MDSTERQVEAYLKSIGYTEIRYEPDGNHPPDFLVNGRLAIEVRRLNQNHGLLSGKKARGLEEIAIPLWAKFRKYLSDIKTTAPLKQSWWVFYSFQRPVPEWKAIQAELDKVLLPFAESKNPQPFEEKINLGGGFEISVLRTSAPKSTFFVAGGYSDDNSGGWVLHEIVTNLEHCIKEKSAKIQNVRQLYPEWWLVLPNFIGFGLDAFERDYLQTTASIQPGGFDRVVVLDRNDPKSSVVISDRNCPAKQGVTNKGMSST